ncbi:4-hydroxybenzoate octaprenyltransferase [Pikeienuella sp. HZG-20]|uniref:4-hydroxybenzoate octaprenyltransferase n=1 Tax=Paludibacillus litoralis TaxID=3133267 RepID=UPI0030EC4066
MTERTNDASPASPPLDANGRVADATDRNWVDRFMPGRLRPWLRLSRADRPAGTWLLLLPCWWSLALAIAATGWRIEDFWLFSAMGLGAFLMRGAGCTWNDITDRNIDGEVERTRSRPIPSGQVGVKGAAAWMIAQALIAFGILLTFNSYAIWLGIVALLPVAIYPFMKRVTWWPQIFLGLAFNWGALMGWAAHTGGLTAAPLILYLAGIAWTLHYDTVYAHQDKEDDALIGVKSTARLFAERTHVWLIGFVALTTLGAGAAAALSLDGAALNVALVGVAAFGAHLAWQIRRLDIDDVAVCLRLFRSNRDTGLILLAGFLAAGLV